MDHYRLAYLVFVMSVTTLMTSCASHQTQASTTLKKPASLIHSKLPPVYLTQLTENFLDHEKGYQFVVRDQARGFFVTEWTSETALRRHRIIIRVTPDDEGSFLSSHFETQIQEKGSWSLVLSAKSREQNLLRELEAYLAKTTLK